MASTSDAVAEKKEEVPTPAFMKNDEAPTPVFGKKKEENEEAAGAADESEEATGTGEEDTGANFAPIVQLTEQQVSSGEEDETTLYEVKAKLYRFDKERTEWKERGVGQIKILEHKQNEKIRVLMRQNRTLKICANFVVLPGMSLQEHAGSEKSWVWHAADFADGELKDELFAIRFGSVENAQNFKNAFEDATEKMSKLLGVGPSEEENAAADETADALGGLKVKEEHAGSSEEAPKEKEEKSKETEEEH
jgi:Ran-binding protein 1